MKLKLLLSVGFLFTAHFASADVTILFNDEVIPVEQTLADPVDLWVTPEDMTRINGFELKPEGACLNEICIPIKQDEDSRVFVRRLGQSWVNLSELARKLQQPFVSDAESSVWSFGAIPSVRKPFLESAIAPDFELEDRNGDLVRLSDLRGKKVVIMTWASW